jgi:hypothetical protein
MQMHLAKAMEALKSIRRCAGREQLRSATRPQTGLIFDR